MSDEVIDLGKERNRRRPEHIEHVTRVTFDEMHFGTSEANGDDPPMAMLGCYGGALVMVEEDARRIGLELLELATILKMGQHK